MHLERSCRGIKNYIDSVASANYAPNILVTRCGGKLREERRLTIVLHGVDLDERPFLWVCTNVRNGDANDLLFDATPAQTHQRDCTNDPLHGALPCFGPTTIRLKVEHNSAV